MLKSKQIFTLKTITSIQKLSKAAFDHFFLSGAYQKVQNVNKNYSSKIKYDVLNAKFQKVGKLWTLCNCRHKMIFDCFYDFKISFYEHGTCCRFFLRQIKLFSSPFGSSRASWALKMSIFWYGRHYNVPNIIFAKPIITLINDPIQTSALLFICAPK